MKEARSLLRTNMKLTGNVKLALHTEITDVGSEENSQTATAAISDKVFFEPIESSLPTYNLKANMYSSSYEYDIRKFYEYYKDFFYSRNNTMQFNQNRDYYISQSENDARETNFEFGVKRVSHQKNGYQFAFLAPIYFINAEQFPDTFVIVLKNKGLTRVNGVNQYDDVYHTLRINLREGDLWNKYLSKYIEQIDDKIIKLDINSFSSYYFGIDAAHGGFIKVKDNVSKTLFASELTLNEFDNIITNSFMKNNMVMSQILNLSFYFNIDNKAFSDINPLDTDFDYFAEYEISGYYEKDGKKVDFWDLDFDYQEEYINLWTGKEEPFDDDTTNLNVFSLLGENTYTGFKYTSKMVPQINKWVSLLNEDYRINLSEAYSSKENGNGFYFDTIPHDWQIPSAVRTGYESVRYNLDWFEYPDRLPYNELPATIVDRNSIYNYLKNFMTSDTLAEVYQNSVLYKGYQYTFSEVKNYSGYKFGVVLTPVRNFINTNYYIKYDKDNIYELEDANGQKYIFKTILLNVPILDDGDGDDSVVSITPKMLYERYALQESAELFSIIPTRNVMFDLDRIHAKAYLSNNYQNGVRTYFYIGDDDTAKMKLSEFKGEWCSYIDSIDNPDYEHEKFELFKSNIFLAPAPNIMNNVVYINTYKTDKVDPETGNTANAVYYLSSATATKLQKVIFENKVTFVNDGMNSVHEGEMLTRLLSETWQYADRGVFISPSKNVSAYTSEQPQYQKHTLDDIFAAITRGQSGEYSFYLDALNDKSSGLTFNWAEIRDEIIRNGLLNDTIGPAMLAPVAGASPIEVDWMRFYIRYKEGDEGDDRAEVINLKYVLNEETDTETGETKYGNTLYATNLGYNMVYESSSDVWNDSQTYEIYETIKSNGAYYAVDANLGNIPTITEKIILGLLPLNNRFKEYQPPYYIEIKKRLVKEPVTISNRSGVQETDIKCYDNSIYKIKMYRYMGFIVPKMRKVEPVGFTGRTHSYIKNYYCKKVKDTSDTILSYTSQTEYLPIYESIDQYTLYRPKIDLYMSNPVLDKEGNEIDVRLTTKTVTGADINEFQGNRIYSTFSDFTNRKPLEYKYFNASAVRNAAPEIKLTKDDARSSVTPKEMLSNYLKDHYGYLGFSDEEIKYFVDLYDYKEKKEYADRWATTYTTKITYTLK